MLLQRILLSVVFTIPSFGALAESFSIPNVNEGVWDRTILSVEESETQFSQDQESYPLKNATIIDLGDNQFVWKNATSMNSQYSDHFGTKNGNRIVFKNDNIPHYKGVRELIIWNPNMIQLNISHISGSDKVYVTESYIFRKRL